MTSVDRQSDVELVGSVAEVVRHPRAARADSFVLHAPLELAARSALLPFVVPDERPRARGQIAAIAAQYEAFGPAAPRGSAREYVDLATAARALAAAVAATDLDAVDAAAEWLGKRASPAELGALLADMVVPSLAAAAHGAIFLWLLERVSPRGELTGELLRPLARELAADSTWQLTWPSCLHREGGPTGSPSALFAALQATPALGVPGSTFIYPLMAQVDRDGVAEALLTPSLRGLGVHEASAVIQRAAALSMLLEPGDHAPYGWSHCLTMPQATLGIAHWCTDPSLAVAVAATYVVGFRAALAREPLAPTFAPPPPGVDVRTALAESPDLAAAAAWHTPAERTQELVALLATRAAVHSDAHLAKHTLACFDAAATHAADARLYLAASARLHGWWAARDLTTATVASA